MLMVELRHAEDAGERGENSNPEVGTGGEAAQMAGVGGGQLTPDDKGRGELEELKRSVARISAEREEESKQMARLVKEGEGRQKAARALVGRLEQLREVGVGLLPGIRQMQAQHADDLAQVVRCLRGGRAIEGDAENEVGPPVVGSIEQEGGLERMEAELRVMGSAAQELNLSISRKRAELDKVRQMLHIPYPLTVISQHAIRSLLLHASIHSQTPPLPLQRSPLCTLL